MFAVIETGGKQYLVKTGDTLKVEKLFVDTNQPAAAGQEVVFEHVLLTTDDNGTNVKLGKPYLDGVAVKAVVEVQGRADKIRVVKYKRKVRYKLTFGHR